MHMPPHVQPAAAQAVSLARDAQLAGVPWHTLQFVVQPVDASVLPPASPGPFGPPEELEPSTSPPLLPLAPLLLSLPASSDAGSPNPGPGSCVEQPAVRAIAASATKAA